MYPSRARQSFVVARRVVRAGIRVAGPGPCPFPGCECKPRALPASQRTRSGDHRACARPTKASVPFKRFFRFAPSRMRSDQHSARRRPRLTSHRRRHRRGFAHRHRKFVRRRIVDLGRRHIGSGWLRWWSRFGYPRHGRWPAGCRQARAGCGRRGSMHRLHAAMKQATLPPACGSPAGANLLPVCGR